MKKAFAIGAWLPNRWHERQLLACIRSIRIHGHKEDIYVLTIDPHLKNRIGERDWKVLTYPEITYEGISTELTPENFQRSDAQKLHFWFLPDNYDKVIGLDTDILFHKNCNDLFELPATSGFVIGDKSQILKLQPPISFGHFVYKPDVSIANDLFNITKKGFSSTKGWNNHGLLDWDGEKHNWDYLCSSTSQGYLYYYFAVLKNKVNGVENKVFNRYLTHFCGKLQRSEPERYQTAILKLIGV